MRINALVLASLLSLAGCAATPPASPSVHWISVQDLQSSLSGAAPMAVGFDIDDTVLFSSACFYYGQQKYSPGSADYLHNPAFWQETNGGCDRYSLPKQAAREVIELHKQRGDRIYFITGRPHTEGEQLTAILASTFGIRDMQPVVFTSGPEKARFIHDRGLKVYYGDSDSDITSAQSAGARPIRIMRAANSTLQPLPDNGALGEEVLVDSTH
ncbi:acid phosphatase AphA [Pseudomonas helleri]|uniref:acid phosphatase AphA n=1 Tax=Pseudomonas helleri TaxID=1608996 RepID=UPI002B20B7B5|nr:acid phosphatase AphA [Pseudomonas helleri]